MDEQTLNFLRAHKVGEDQLKHLGKLYPYWLIEADVPGLPDFVGFPEDGVPFISTKVSPRWRPYFLGHEIDEFSDPSIMHDNNRCVLALKKELARVSEGDQKEYLPYRLNFFNRLIAFSLSSGDKDFIRRITASRDYLHNLVDKLRV